MFKKSFALFLVMSILLSLVVPVFAVETGDTQGTYVTILNLKSLEKLAEKCRLDRYSQNLVVSLQTDLDLEGRDFSGIPIFCGRFEGNGHSIRGLNLTMEGSAHGFFRYLTETAVVQNLHLEGTVRMQGSAAQIGGIAGRNSGTIRNCSFSGEVSGKEFIGGIVGQNAVSGIIENCNMFGTVYGDHFIGGIAGKNAGVIRGCVNEAKINETPQKNSVKLEDVTLSSVFQSESVSTVTDLGGIAGNSSGLIRDCKNLASVGYSNMGYNIGGIVGTQSGLVQNCENYGQIFGRKEVGGIAGQMEPSAVMKFEEDVLQILSRQLDGMGHIVSDAASNVQSSGEAIIGQVNNMHYYVSDAKDAVLELLPDKENGTLPDMDAIQAAQNSLSSSLYGMTDSLNGISATAYSAIGAVSSDLDAMKDQINVMRATVSNVSETLGGSIVDLSDEDTPADITGKVADCRNYGAVEADLNGGGITGAMAMPNDADVEENLLVTGNDSLNFESEIRAVILNCENDAAVTVDKQNAGGIVGLQSLGLVRNSRNFGKVDAAKANYVGGISGNSMGFIRSSHANGEISGKNYVGGIAGAATIATDCYALVRIHDSVEKFGAILGYQEENTKEEEEQPLERNYYLPIIRDLGAVDGISYADLAQPVGEEVFFALEGLPERFSQSVITFQYGNGTSRKFNIEFGSSFPEEWIPPIPPKEDRQAYWEGLDDILRTGVFFDVVVQQKYTSQTTILESVLTRAEIPLLFVQGIFSEDAEVSVRAMESTAGLPDNVSLIEAWVFETSEPMHQTQLRLQLPESADAEKIRILILDGGGIWREAQHNQFGRYAVVGLEPYDNAVALVQKRTLPWVAPAAVLAGVLMMFGIVYIGKEKKKKAQ